MPEDGGDDQQHTEVANQRRLRYASQRVKRREAEGDAREERRRTQALRSPRPLIVAASAQIACVAAHGARQGRKCGRRQRHAEDRQ